MPKFVAGQFENPLATHRSDIWNRRWGDDSYQPQFQLVESDAVLREAVEVGWFTPTMRAVDVGCGLGYDAAWLAEQGFEVVGIDFSIRAIERAREAFAGSPRLTFEVVDIVQPSEYFEAFDALVDRGCLHGIDRRMRPAYVRNLEAWARPNAHFLLFMRTKGQSANKTVARSRRILEPGFKLIDARAVNLGGSFTDEPLPGMAMRFVRAS